MMAKVLDGHLDVMVKVKGCGVIYGLHTQNYKCVGVFFILNKREKVLIFR